MDQTSPTQNSCPETPTTTSAKNGPIKHLKLFTNTLIVGLILLLVGWVTAQIWKLHQRDIHRHQIKDRIALAVDSAHSDNIDQAIHLLTIAVEMCESEPSLKDEVEFLSLDIQRLERYQDFCQRAKQIPTDCVHLLEESSSDPLARRCEEALAVYDMDDPKWETSSLAPPLFRPEQASNVKPRASDIMTILALRLAVHNRGQLNLATTQRALNLLRRAEVLGGPSHVRGIIRSECYQQRGDSVLADRAAEEARRLPPQTGQDFYIRGFVAEQLHHDLKRASEEYALAIAREPNHFGAHLGLFLVSPTHNAWPSRITELTACIALRPQEHELYFLRGLAHFQREEYPLALEDFDICVERNGKHSAVRYWRGRVYILAGRWADADSDFTLALRLDPKRIAAFPWRAMARAKRGRHQEAAQDAEIAVKQLPDAETAWQAARTLGQCVKAIQTGADPSENKALADQYGSRAVELLRLAVARGLTRTPGQREAIRISPELDPLRARRDFEDLLYQVELHERR